MTDLRAERRAATRERIVQATLDLLADHDPAAISMPVVAEASGVSLRTLYRYFPAKGDLLEAAGGWFDGQVWARAVGRSGIDELTVDDFRTYQQARFADFDANRAGVLAQVTTPSGRDLRRRRVDEQRLQVLANLRREGLGLDDDDLERLADVILATSASTMFLELVDRLGHDHRDAADLTVWVAEAVVAHAIATGTTRPADSLAATLATAPSSSPHVAAAGADRPVTEEARHG